MARLLRHWWGMFGVKKMRARSQGFTLIEILVALFIFAILAVMASIAIDNVMRDYRGMTKSNQAIGELQVAMIRFNRDVLQMVARPASGPQGNPIAPIIANSEQLEFTTADVNPFNKSRGDLRRVAYKLLGGNLVRLTWPVLDQAPTIEPLPQPVLSGIQELEFHFIDKTGKAYSYWPINNNESTDQSGSVNSLLTLPAAVELTMQVVGLGKVERTIPVSGAFNVG